MHKHFSLCKCFAEGRFLSLLNYWWVRLQLNASQPLQSKSHLFWSQIVVVFFQKLCCVLPHNFPGWQQLAPQTVGNTEAQRVSCEAEEPEIQQRMKDIVSICEWIALCHSWQTVWTLEWCRWLGLEDGCWQLDNL